MVRTDHGYRLGVPRTEVDALAITDRVAAARAAVAAGDLALARDRTRPVVETTIDLETGDGALGDVRREAGAQVAEAGRLLGQALSGLGHHDEALDLLEGSLAADPDDEVTLEALLRSESVVRGAPAALERFERYRETLGDRLGTDPGPALQQLHTELLVRDRPVREGLLYEASRLIGRDEDVAALAETIRTSRVTSIVGAGRTGQDPARAPDGPSRRAAGRALRRARRRHLARGRRGRGGRRARCAGLGRRPARVPRRAVPTWSAASSTRSAPRRRC